MSGASGCTPRIIIRSCRSADPWASRSCLRSRIGPSRASISTFPSRTSDSSGWLPKLFTSASSGQPKIRWTQPPPTGWSPATDGNPLIDAVSSYVSGTELSRLSVHDTEEYLDTDQNWRVRPGYGALVAAFGTASGVATNTVVRSVDHSGSDKIRIETSRRIICASKVICTIPTTLLAAEALRFDPPLVAKIDAAAGLPLGSAEKVMLHVAEADELPVDGHLFGATDRTATGSYDLRPMGQPCIEAFFGGSLARELQARGELADFAIEELINLFGSNFRDRNRVLACSAWAGDCLSGGSYSYALPSHAGVRTRLAEPVDDRIFFAGEATSQRFFSTAHGAYQSGRRAAMEAMRSLGIASQGSAGSLASP